MKGEGDVFAALRKLKQMARSHAARKAVQTVNTAALTLNAVREAAKEQRRAAKHEQLCRELGRPAGSWRGR